MADGYRLRAVRMGHGYTQQQVAELLGVTRNAYNMYERGKRDIPLGSLMTLADWYGCTTDELLGTTAWRRSHDDTQD